MERQIFLSEQQIKLIQRLPLFRGVSDEFKDRLLDKLDYSITQLKKGETIFVKVRFVIICIFFWREI